MIRVGIVGAGGYTAGELLRLLRHHPKAEVVFAQSNSQKGNPVVSIHDDLFDWPDLYFTDQLDTTVDVLFLCMGHGQSRIFFETHSLPAQTLVIDLGNDFRLDASFVYGLPELYYNRIKETKRIANPGCFATAIQLALLPLAKEGLLQDEVHVHAITGSTGAGQALQATSHFSWRHDNLSTYKVFSHQHMEEIMRSLEHAAAAKVPKINFVPLRGPFTRGIFATSYTECSLQQQDLVELYSTYYGGASFTRLTHHAPHLKQVVNTNYCLLHVEKIDDKVLVTSVIDNLLKGASGQALHNMNLAMGLEEQLGLALKAGYF